MRNGWRWKAAQFAERKWWQNYLRKKDVTDYLAWKKAYWQNLWNQCLPFINLLPTANLLDAGCGPAGIFILFPNHSCTAFDPLLEAYEQDLPHFKKSRYPNVEFVQTGLEDFQSSKLFDLIFCMNAINHVEDIQRSYDTLVAHASPQASLVITIDAHNHSFFRKLFRLLPGDILHPHQLNIKEYTTLITERGCEVIETKLLKKEFFFSHYLMIARKK